MLIVAVCAGERLPAGAATSGSSRARPRRRRCPAQRSRGHRGRRPPVRRIGAGPAPVPSARRGGPRAGRRRERPGARSAAAGVRSSTRSAGTTLYDSAASATAAPASTAKLLTAAAVLTVRPPSDRIATTVVAGPAPGQRGAGRRRRPDAQRRADRHADGHVSRRRPARRPGGTARARPECAPRRSSVDDSLFTGPAVVAGLGPRRRPERLRGADHRGDGRRRPGRADRHDSQHRAGPRGRPRAGRARSASRTRACTGVGTRRRAGAGERALGAVRGAGRARCCRARTTSSPSAWPGRSRSPCSAPATFAGAAAAVAAVLRRLGVAARRRHEGRQRTGRRRPALARRRSPRRCG